MRYARARKTTSRRTKAPNRRTARSTAGRSRSTRRATARTPARRASSRRVGSRSGGVVRIELVQRTEAVNPLTAGMDISKKEPAPKRAKL